MLLALLALSATAKEEGAASPSEENDVEEEIEDISEDLEDFSLVDGDQGFLRGRKLYPGWCRENSHCGKGKRW